MSGQIRSYRDLQVWQRAMQLTADVYRLTARFPNSERFGLVVQLQRAAVSVPSNIAEGHERRSTREFLRFLSIASGSLAELETQLMLSVNLALASTQTVQPALDNAAELGRMLNGLRNKLEEKLTAPTLASGL